MKSNFYFLENEWPQFFQRAGKAEKLVITDPRTSLTYARMALELAVNWMYNNDQELEKPYSTNLSAFMMDYQFKNQFPNKLYRDIDLIRHIGNLAIHNKPVTAVDSEKVITNLFYFAKWFAKSYTTEKIEEIGLFDYTLIPKEGEAALSKKQLSDLQAKLNKDLDSYKDQLSKSLERNKELEEKNELFRQQIEQLQTQIEANKQTASHEDEIHHPRNEQETRKYLIDVALREAGWDLSGANDKEYEVSGMPLSTNPTGVGFVDYVLWDDNGKPLALVEAKKTMDNAKKGENQAQLYADCLEYMHGQRPVIFYTNGFETYIWDDKFYKQARLVYGFYTKKELQTLHYRRENRHDIRTQAIDTSISDRNYQMRAIKSVAEHFAGNDKHTQKLIGTNRGALLVLATGTGKTRVSIALTKMMFDAKWVKRVLFLADRRSLVKQAKVNFNKYMPDYSIANLLEDRENPDTRLVFSTYQTLIGLIDEVRDDKERFYGVGHFDLIIVDEAHRSIYKKYQAIFEYFDALFLGLTATPKESIDRNTYKVFGLPDKAPTDAYTFKEAVKDKFLVPYRTIEVPTKFKTQGIKYKDLSDEEKEEFEKEILDGEKATGNEWINKEALDRWLFNEDTAIKTLRYILKAGIKKRGGDEIGKTIVFARNQKHAEFIKDMFLKLDKELYGNDYVKVITHNEPKAQEFIERFCDEEKERLPQIAISVDMLDTGIDAPSVVNLVFYKPVKSYTKFWQMIGRGSRLRPDLFGKGNHKKKFYIFDLFGNFEFFDENPEGAESDTTQRSLSEIVFGLKLQLAQYLKQPAFKEKKELQTFRTELLDNLYNEIANLDRKRFNVRMKIEKVLKYGDDNRELWNHLSESEIHEIEEHLAPLIKPQKGESDLARFYDKLIYSLMINRLETPDAEIFIKKFIPGIRNVYLLSKKLLQKTSIPAIKASESLIKEPLHEEFWKVDGIAHLEKIRAGLRDLIKYIDSEDQTYVTTDFEDELYESKVVNKDMVEDPPKDEYQSPFETNRLRLEEIINENKQNVTINRIRNGEQITEEELRSLEKFLLNGKIQKEDLEKELGRKLDLVNFIIGLTGLSEEKVNQAFAKFINDYQLDSKQIKFLNMIKQFLTKQGKIDPSKLFDKPFINHHSMGIAGVFNDEQADKIFKILEQFGDQKSDVG